MVNEAQVSQGFCTPAVLQFRKQIRLVFCSFSLLKWAKRSGRRAGFKTGENGTLNEAQVTVMSLRPAVCSY